MTLILPALYPQRICIDYFPRLYLLLGWKVHFPLKQFKANKSVKMKMKYNLFLSPDFHERKKS